MNTSNHDTKLPGPLVSFLMIAFLMAAGGSLERFFMISYLDDEILVRERERSSLVQNYIFLKFWSRFIATLLHK